MEEARQAPPKAVRREIAPPAFGDLLRRFRTAIGWTQEQLAERASVSARAVVNYETGVTLRPQRQTVYLLADALGLAPDERALFEAAARARRLPGPRALPQPSPTAAAALPIPPTPLFGRQAAIAAAAALLREGDARLLAITGPGGVGKTRLALAVAATLAADFADGVQFVPLVGLHDPALVLPAIARAVGVREAAGAALADALAAALHATQTLLLLDNCEQVAAAAPAIAALLARCARLRIVVTSRVALRVRGESVFPIGPLAVPALRDPPDLAALARSPAVALFLDRARALAPDFALTEANAAAIAGICVHLDGLPLAIELAAARVRTLAPPELRARLDDRFALLTRGARDLPERQRTLRDAVAWSHDLLDADARRLIRRLAVFVGGWERAAAVAVCAGDDLPAARIPDLLASLADQSLVRPEPGYAGAERLGMYETIRAFIHERLEESGERHRIERAHASYYCDLAEAAEPALTGSEQGAWLERLASEHDNLRAAARWAQRRAETAFGLRIAAALWRFWLARGYLTEGRAWLERALAAAGADDDPALAPLVARASYGVGVLMTEQGDYGGAAALVAAQIARLQAGGRADQTAGLWNILGNIARYRRDFGRARECYESGLRIFRAAGDRNGEGVALNNLGTVAREQGDHAGATDLFEQSLAVKRRLGNARGVGVALVNLADLARDQGEYARAANRLAEAVTIFRALGDRPGLAYALNNYGEVAIGQARSDEARAHLGESLHLFRAQGDQASIAIVLRNLGAAARLGGDAATATAHYEEALRAFAALGNRLGVAECAEGLALVAGTLQRQWARAVWLRGAAAALRDRLGTPLPLADRAAIDAAMVEARGVLGADGFAAAQTAGARVAATADIAQRIAGSG